MKLKSAKVFYIKDMNFSEKAMSFRIIYNIHSEIVDFILNYVKKSLVLKKTK